VITVEIVSVPDPNSAVVCANNHNSGNDRQSYRQISLGQFTRLRDISRLTVANAIENLLDYLVDQIGSSFIATHIDGMSGDDRLRMAERLTYSVADLVQDECAGPVLLAFLRQRPVDEATILMISSVGGRIGELCESDCGSLWVSEVSVIVLGLLLIKC
jgi:hypothetical protein